MANPGYTPDTLAQFAAAYRQALLDGHAPPGVPVGAYRKSARAVAADGMGYTPESAVRLHKAAEGAGLLSDHAEPNIPATKAFGYLAPLVDSDMSVTDLIEHRSRVFEKKKHAYESNDLRRVKVNLSGPIGIMHMGDPHLDADGCDWPTLLRHVELAKRTDGLMAGNVGDFTNNWIGRLARLYSEQSTTAKEGWKLAEWFVGEVPWLYLIGGNHDAWSGAGDPVKWMARQAGAEYTMNGSRIALSLPNGRIIRVNARHDFRGNSQWNVAHGPLKAAMMGAPDHIFTCGHKHTFGQAWHRQPTGEWSCALRVGTYKVYDSFADAMGFHVQNIPAVTTLIFPDAEDEAGLIEVVKTPETAADFLAWARARYHSARTVKRSQFREDAGA